MSAVFHRFKYIVLIAGNLAGLAATSILAVGVATATGSLRPPAGTARSLAVAPLALASGDTPAHGSFGQGLCRLYIALLQSDQYGIEVAEGGGPDGARVLPPHGVAYPDAQ